MRSKQLEFHLSTHGGRRKRAGRKPMGKTALVSHVARPRFDSATPAHVTLKVKGDVPSLRSSSRFRRIQECFYEARGRLGVRLVEYSVLNNHLHLVVEADSSMALTKGMQGLAVRVAKALNAMLRRSGRLFADHYHARLLRTPTELARAIRYVLGNAEHHYGDPGRDPCSSAAPDAWLVLVLPSSWLLRFGWQRAPPRDRVTPSFLRWHCCIPTELGTVIIRDLYRVPAAPLTLAARIE